MRARNGIRRRLSAPTTGLTLSIPNPGKGKPFRVADFFSSRLERPLAQRP